MQLIETPACQGMMCQLCRKHCRRPKSSVVGRAIWVDLPCTTMTKYTLKRHKTSKCHNAAKMLEASLCMSREDRGMQESFAAVESAEKKAMAGAIKCLYWLCKQDIPHTTKYVPLLEVVISLGATYLNDLHLDGNAHYTSVQEAVMSLGSTISRKCFDLLRASLYFALMCNETTDIAVIKEVIIYTRYFDSD